MKRTLVLLATIALLGACGGDKKDATQTTIPDVAVTTTTNVDNGTIAMWPAPDVLFKTPQAAAEDFVSRVLDVPPVVGAFRAGDSRSGEIDVMSRPEGGTQTTVRATLVLRQLGAKNGWFVISAGSKGVTITNLSTGDEVSAGKVVVQGQARGFEGNVVVRAYAVGDDVELSKSVIQAGSMGELQPYKTTIDLSGIEPGTTAFIVVRGGTGLETDPGEFAAVPVLVR